MHWFNMYTINSIQTPIFKIQPRSMVNAAVDWAKSKNLWRVNPIHKEEEIKVVVDDFFRFSEQEGFDTTQRGTMEMEDPSLFQSCFLPHTCPSDPIF